MQAYPCPKHGDPRFESLSYLNKCILFLYQLLPMYPNLGRWVDYSTIRHLCRDYGFEDFHTIYQRIILFHAELNKIATAGRTERNPGE